MKVFDSNQCNATSSQACDVRKECATRVLAHYSFVMFAVVVNIRIVLTD